MRWGWAGVVIIAKRARSRRQLDEDDPTGIAEVIREHLALAGWPRYCGHGQLWGAADNSDGC
jgi:hypothetical protein